MLEVGDELFTPPHLNQIGVPSIATDMQIVVARFLPRGLAKDVS
jgi:hypothetical protein